MHGKLDATKIFDDEGATYTGTVSGFFGIVWGLAERGHVVDAYADVKEEVAGSGTIGGANVLSWDRWPGEDRGPYDAYLSILESDPLSKCPKDKPRICVQWLNDFSYSKLDPTAWADVFVSPSKTHKLWLSKKTRIDLDKIEVVPLSINPELYPIVFNPELFSPETGRPYRQRFSIAYASSPDRGLHHILEFFPEVRKEVPGATLHIYYRVLPWCEEILSEPAHRGSKVWNRATYIRERFAKDGTHGENGVFLEGMLTTRRMMGKLCTTEVLAYPCDPVKFTEGFSVTILDACASGCIPVVSGVDAFPELWGENVAMIDGRPSDPGAKEKWVKTLVRALTDCDFGKDVVTRSTARARELERKTVAKRWEDVIVKTIAGKTVPTVDEHGVAQ